MTALTYAILILHAAGIALSLPTTTTVMASETNPTTSATSTKPTTTVSATAAANWTVGMTSTPEPESDVYCGFMWGGNVDEKGDTCNFFYVIDIGFIVCIVLWALFFVGYQAAMMRKWSSFLMVDLQHKWTKRDYFFYVVLIACSVFWILLAVLLLVYLAFFHAQSEVKTATPASQSANAASPPTGGSGATEQTTLVAEGKGVNSHFNQRFPKIAPGDCRPKYSRVSTSAC